MTIQYLLDFTPYLAQKQCPKLHEVQTFLTCSVTDLPRGNMIIQHQIGKFTLKVHDDSKGKALENRVLKYFLPGDKLGKDPILIKIIKKDEYKRYVNPKYVNIWGVHASDVGDFITNEMLTKTFSEYGTILVPVHDVHDLSENVWSIDKKNFRVDLNKGKNIPRSCPIEYTTGDGKLVKATLRVTYKDQPRFCRQCIAEHTGDCPLWLEKQKRLQEIKAQKELETKTIIIGDSNLKQVNSNALLADVVSSSGAKIGHICNQLRHEKIDKYENIVIFAGVNNIPPSHENVDEVALWKQIEGEMDCLENQLAEHVNKGKNVFLTQVTQARHTSSPRASKLRDKINKRYGSMADKLKKRNKKVKTGVISWPLVVSENDFSSVKAISEQATTKFIHEVETRVGNQKLRATYLDSKLTSYQYANVTPAYPLGCYQCTAMNHSREECPIDFSKKRQASTELEGQPPKIPTGGMDALS